MHGVFLIKNLKKTIMAHIDENFPLQSLFPLPLLVGNRNEPAPNRDAVAPTRLVLEPRSAEDSVRLAGETPAPERPPAERPVEALPTEEGPPTASPHQENPDILGVLNAESLDIGVPRRFVANFQADLRDTLALTVLEAPQNLEPETVVVPIDINPAGPPPPAPEAEVAERGRNIDLLI